jgi:hypothetical protein
MADWMMGVGKKWQEMGEDYRGSMENPKKGKGFNTECTEVSRRTQRKITATANS